MHGTRQLYIQSGTPSCRPPPGLNGHVVNSDRGPMAESRRRRDRPRACTATLTAGIPSICSWYLDLFHGHAGIFAGDVLQPVGVGLWQATAQSGNRPPGVRFPDPDLRKTPNAAGSGKKRGLDLVFSLLFLAWPSRKGRVETAGSGLGGCSIYFAFAGGTRLFLQRIKPARG